MGSMAVAGAFAEKAACITSSHFASAEKEFRFPLAYGNQRPKSATWTVTGSGAFILSAQPGRQIRAVISGVTIGKIMARYRLWDKGFNEYGRVYGSGRGGYH